MQRCIIIYGKYFWEFYNLLDSKIQEKIDWVFNLVKFANIIPQKYFKHLANTDGLFEIRVEYESNIYRMLCFFDDDNLVVLVNAFQKKSQKTPKKELELAKKLKAQYFIDKKIRTKNAKGKNFRK